MPLPPYLRFPENGAIHQKFWGLRPRNPTCGLISLETGAKMYAWGNFIMKGALVILIVVAMFMVVRVSSKGPSHEELMQGLKNSKLTAENPGDDWVDKLYLKQSSTKILMILLIFLILYGFLMSLFWRLKTAIEERDIPMLKKYFIIALFLEFLELIMFDVETEYMWTHAFLVDIPLTIFTIIGLVCMYSFIASLVNPDNGRDEDTNRIQFNV